MASSSSSTRDDGMNAPFAPLASFEESHVTLELRIARLFSHTELSKLIVENDEPWQRAFRVFTERNYGICLDTWTRSVEGQQEIENAPQIRLNEPIVNFPMDGRHGGNVSWYNRDLSAYVQIIPRATDADAFVSDDPRDWVMDGVVIQHVDPEPSLAAGEAVERSDSVVSYETSIPDQDRFALQADQMSMETFGTAQTAAETDSMRTAATHSSDAENEQPPLSTVMACMILSCLLQYTPELFGILSPYCFTVLRRFIFPEVISMVHHGAIDLITDSGIAIHESNQMPEHQKGFRSFVEFDRGKLESCFDEWLSVGGLKRDKASPSNPGHFHRDGRSAGIIVSGARGVGKTMFCRALIRCLVDMAPWAITVLYRQREVGSFYDGVYFLDELATASENHLLQVHPLSLGSQYASEASPRGLRRIIKLFRDFRDVAEPGKIVITLIDNMDNITKTLQAHSVFTQLRAESENAGFEFFILGTNNSAALPNFDSIDSTRNLFRVNNFRTMKVYPMPLHRAFDFLLRHIQHPPRLAFPKSVMEEVRRCGNSIHASRNSHIWTPFELRMHNLNISDMRKISLHANLDLAQRIMQRQQSQALPSIGGSISETPLAPLSNTECQRMLYASLERVFNATPTLTGLSPNAVVVLPWLRHDLSPFGGVENAADEIYKRCTYQRQYIQFIRVITSDEYETEREFEEKAKKGKYGHVTIPQRSITSLMHHLHKRFMFRQSYLLESPEQLLPFHPKLSAHIPRFNLNPIDHFYWQQRDSLLVMNSLESLVTYHEEVEHKCLTVNEKERIQQKTTANDFESARMVEAGLGMDMSWSQTLSNATANTESMTAGRKTGTTGEVSAEVRPLEFEFGIPEVKGSVRKAWENSRNIGSAVGRSVGATQNVAPAIVLNGLVSITSSAKQGKTLNRFDLTMDREGESFTRVFELPETRTKVVSGLKMFCDTHYRFVEELRNVVLIFYRHEGCYEEVAVKRLGWKKDGSFESARVGCGHYHRHLRVKAPCCSEWVYCEQCHDEKHADHKMDPKSVSEIQCLICSTRQTIVGPEEQATATRTHGIRCSNPSCGRRFAIVSCPECRIWRDHVSPGGLHHCQRCGHCYSQAYYPLHEQLCNGSSA